LTSALSGYLPLTGGTLTGALSGTSASFSGGITFGANNRGFAREPAGDVEIGGSAGAALKLYANNVEYAKIAPSTGFTTTLALSGTSATFSGIITANSAASAANGSINIENSDPTLRFRVTGGTANSRIYEWRAIAAGGASDIMQLRLWNDAQSSVSTLFTIASTGAATFSGDVTISKTSPTFRLTRGTTSASSLVVYNTNGTDDWLIGTGITGTNSDYRIYNNGTGTDAIYIAKSNNATTFTSTSVTIGSGGGAGTLTLSQSGVRNWKLSSGAITSGSFSIINGSDDSAALSINGSNAVSIPGALSKGSGSFRIEHPLPSLSETHQLVHSFIEGPKADLIYRGKLTLVNGKAQANIDEVSTMTEGTFEVLCREVQCFTTNESGWDLIKGKVIGNIIYIESQNEKSTDEISWMVIGERKDKHMMDTEWTDENGKVIVEPLKPIEPEPMEDLTEVTPETNNNLE